MKYEAFLFDLGLFCIASALIIAIINQFLLMKKSAKK